MCVCVRLYFVLCIFLNYKIKRKRKKIKCFNLYMVKYLTDKKNHVVFFMKIQEHVSQYILGFNN
jgi:hypothetical protein